MDAQRSSPLNSRSVVFDSFDADVVSQALDDALQYAVLSKPFTVNRMRLSIDRCLTNIAKGKLVEYLFREACREKGIVLEVDRCTTPFWKRDQRDFVLHNREWDVKSLFLHQLPPKAAFDECPALIPNRFPGDQWSTRATRYLPDLIEPPASVFVFLSTLNLSLELDRDQSTFLAGMCREFGEREALSEPFKSDWYLDHFPRFHELSTKIDSMPVMAITGVASQFEWGRFSSVQAKPFYVDGVRVFTTRIPNMWCRAGDLMPFADIVGW